MSYRRPSGPLAERPVQGDSVPNVPVTLRRDPEPSSPLPTLAALLAVGPLLSVPDVAEQVLGRAVDPRTALRWAMNGRGGVKLPTLRGAQRMRCTTVAAFRAWIEQTSEHYDARPVAAQPQPAAVDVGADAILAAINPKLGRRSKAGAA